MLRPVLAFAILGYAAAFAPMSALPGLRPASARAGACSVRMVDWSDPKDNEPYSGAGADRGQINRSDQVWDRTAQRIAQGRQNMEEKGYGAKSGLDKSGNLREGDRDPTSGRLILDPLKIPTAEQGAPGSWEEYMAMRKAKEGTVTDAMGNVIEDVKPSYEVQPGTWGAPKSVDKVNVDDLFEDKSVSGFNTELDVSDVVDDAQEAWRREREAERAEQEAAIEAKMQMWLKQAEEKKRAEGGM